MLRQLILGLSISAFLWVGSAGITSASAQSGSQVAFINTSGQLIVSDTSGAYRWILTNPGETLVNNIGYAWSRSGDRIFFAVEASGEASLRVGTPSAQSAAEIGRVPSNTLTGGVWTVDGSGIIVSSGESVLYFDASGGGSAGIVDGANVPNNWSDDRPNTPRPSAVSPNGQTLLLSAGDGRLSALRLDGGGNFAIPGSNELTARQNGLWSDAASFVATWGYETNSVLNVTNTDIGQTVTLDSGRSTPITPIAWVSGTTVLLYRDAGGFVRGADLSCLSSGCGTNPLEAGIEVLSASASDVQVQGSTAFYRDGDGVYALPLSCLNAGNCLSAAIFVGGQAAPGTFMHTRGGTLVYTAYSADPNNPSDRMVMAVTTDCVNSGACAPQTVLAGATAGLLASSGRAVIVEGASIGISILDLNTGATVTLSDYSGGQLLPYARWNG